MKEHLYDKRVVKRALQEGLLSKEEYQRWLDALPDLTHKLQTEADEAARLAAQQAAHNAAALASAAASSLDDDDDLDDDEDDDDEDELDADAEGDDADEDDEDDEDDDEDEDAADDVAKAASVTADERQQHAQSVEHVPSAANDVSSGDQEREAEDEDSERNPEGGSFGNGN
jgi:hypothetical protein